MTGVNSIEDAPWTRSRWFWTVATLIAFQVAFVWFLSNHSIGKKEWPVRPLTVRLDPESAAMSDPTIFTLAHPKSFSGSAWLHEPDFPYEPRSRIEPHTWYEGDPARFGSRFSEIVRAEFPELVERTEGPILTIIEVPPPRPLTLSRASRSLEEVPSGWILNSRQSLPAAEPGVALSKCRVGVYVNAKGETFSPVLLDSSGSDSADREALEYVNSARFEKTSKKADGKTAKTMPSTYVYFVFEWLAERSGAGSEPLSR